MVREVDATVVAELAFGARGEPPEVTTITPLVDEGRVVVPLPYAQRGLAERLAAADQVVLVASDERLALRDWQPLALRGRVEVVADPDGRRFRDRLLEQELRKHPPSRLLLDSLRDRRDHWWYLPRLLCYLVDLDEPWSVGRRNTPTTGLLAWWSEDLHAQTVEVLDAPDVDRLRLRALTGVPLVGDDVAASLYRHDESLPDLETRCERREWGRLNHDVLRCDGRDGELRLPSPPTLLERLRRHRRLAKECRRELGRARTA